MLIFDNPAAAANALSDYVVVHYSSIPERLQPLALAASRERSPVVAIVRGMELLYAVTREEGWAGEAEITYNTLGALANQVSENDFWAKGARALELQRLVKHELGELPEGATVPEPPAVDGEYAPAAPEEPAP